MLDRNGLVLRLRGAARDDPARQARTFNETSVLRDRNYVLLQLKAVQNCSLQQRLMHQVSAIRGAHILCFDLGFVVQHHV
jgi:hypothetical protein